MKAASLALLGKTRRTEFLESLSREEVQFLSHDWLFWARPDQMPPESSWTTWLVMGGRGAGKTRTGAEWVRNQVHLGRAGRIALVAEDYGDAREVMVEGPSGLRAIGCNGERPAYETSRRRLLWPNGAVATLHSASDPEQLRGPQFDAAWSDEVAKWTNAEDAWDMLQFGLRLGAHPRQVATTTPRPVPLIRRLLSDETVTVTRASTFDNRAHLAGAFLNTIVRTYEGTRLGRQELMGELLDDNPGALWSRELIETSRCKAAPPLVRVVVAVDPPASSTRKADACGIVAAGTDSQGCFYVLADRTMKRAKPAAWARKAVQLFQDVKADRIIAEVNQGGDMVGEVLRQVAPDVPLQQVRATRGKLVRAEPVAALYEQGRVHHVGAFPELEDQLCAYDGSGKSPDRLDALVWAITGLMRRPAQPLIRRL